MCTRMGRDHGIQRSRRPDDRPRVFRGAEWSIGRRRPAQQPPLPPTPPHARFGELFPLLAAHRSTSTSVVSELCRRPPRPTPRRPPSSRARAPPRGERGGASNSWRSASSRARFTCAGPPRRRAQSRGRLRCHRRSSRRRRRRRRRRLTLFGHDLVAHREVREISEYHPAASDVGLCVVCVRVYFVCRSCLLGVRVVGSHSLRPVIAISRSRSLVILGIAVPPTRLSSHLYKTVIQPRQPEPLRAARRHRRRLAVQLVRKRARPPRWRPAARCDRRGSGATCRRGGVSTQQRGGRRRKLLAARGRRAASIDAYFGIKSATHSNSLS